MGGNFAPSYANLAMGLWEQCFIWYIDNIIIIWDGPRMAHWLKNSYLQLQSCHHPRWIANVPKSQFCRNTIVHAQNTMQNKEAFSNTNFWIKETPLSLYKKPTNISLKIHIPLNINDQLLPK